MTTMGQCCKLQEKLIMKSGPEFSLCLSVPVCTRAPLWFPAAVTQSTFRNFAAMAQGVSLEYCPFMLYSTSIYAVMSHILWRSGVSRSRSRVFSQCSWSFHLLCWCLRFYSHPKSLMLQKSVTGFLRGLIRFQQMSEKSNIWSCVEKARLMDIRHK